MHWAMIICITNDGCQIYQDAQEKQQTQYQFTPKSKWKMLTNYWKFQNRSVQTFGFVYHDTNGLNHGPVWKVRLFCFSGICTVILWQDFMGNPIWGSSFQWLLGNKFRTGNACSLTEKKHYSFVFYVDDMKLARKKQNINPTWKVQMKDVDLEERTLFLDHVYMGRRPRECRISKDIVDNYRDMFESRISVGRAVFQGNLEQTLYLANKTTRQLYKVATPCLDDHPFKEDENGSVGETSTVCSQIVLTCLYLVRIGRPDIFMVCEHTCSCGHMHESLWHTFSAFDLVHFIMEMNSSTISTWVTQYKQCRLGLLQDSDFAGDLRTQN